MNPGPEGRVFGIGIRLSHSITSAWQTRQVSIYINVSRPNSSVLSAHLPLKHFNAFCYTFLFPGRLKIHLCLSRHFPDLSNT